jgi:hypothetical protein
MYILVPCVDGNKCNTLGMLGMASRLNPTPQKLEIAQYLENYWEHHP